MEQGKFEETMRSKDPIYEENGEWYFWDETWSDSYGPFDTKEIAKQKLENYCKLML